MFNQIPEKLSKETITFGKYKDKTLSQLLRDRKYCTWLLQQEWFQTSYEYLYNRVMNHKPIDYFLTKPRDDATHFLDRYIYFNLETPENIEKFDILNETEKKCYTYYLSSIARFRNKIITNIEELKPNPFDIKAPTKWLQEFEITMGISRDDLKEFLSAYELPTIPHIIEDIKKEGGIEYLGAKTFHIAKKNSEKQEGWWHDMMKRKYGENVCAQFKYKNCLFDFLNIPLNTIFECKLGLKDFNSMQYRKYLLALEEYTIVYLIGCDAIIDIPTCSIFTTNVPKYVGYVSHIPDMREKSYLDVMIEKFDIIEVKNLEEYLPS
jgi:hypothetical protein